MNNDSNIVYFVYDGECPICQAGASMFTVKQAVGQVQTVDARTEKHHPVMQEIYEAQLDLDEGMVIKYEGELYQGDEALHHMARLGADDNVLNAINNRLFASRTFARLSYPSMRAVRNVALKLKGVGRIRNLEAHNE